MGGGSGPTDYYIFAFKNSSEKKMQTSTLWVQENSAGDISNKRSVWEGYINSYEG